MSATVCKVSTYVIAGFFFAVVVPACSTDKPAAPPKKTEQQVVLVKPKRPVMTEDQRKELGFPSDVIAKVELAAGAEAEPFFVVVEVPSKNLKGEEGLEQQQLKGFSVHTKHADELIIELGARLRARGFLIFRSVKSYGELPDLVTVVRGHSSYDILKIQGTEAPNYHLDTKAIVAWLKKRQQDGTFTVTGAGPDWLEARFIKPPRNMLSFAWKSVAFAPDVRTHSHGSVAKLAEKMKRTNSFTLEWD